MCEYDLLQEPMKPKVLTYRNDAVLCRMPMCTCGYCWTTRPSKSTLAAARSLAHACTGSISVMRDRLCKYIKV